jgi:glycosyltransferase involved in cell wall biosynthesis
MEYIEKNKRPKILLLCDDLRYFSGVSTVAKEIVTNTAQCINWVNVGGAINNPDKGKKLDLSEELNTLLGISDASAYIYPVDGYGDPKLIRSLIDIEKPDALFIITDPRYWVWLFQIESEIRKKCPIVYLNIWDSMPAPYYNKSYYESCDTLLAISKQTENINKLVLGDKAKDKLIKYVPHGVSEKYFHPLDKNDPKLIDFKNKLFEGKEYDFVAFFNSRNIRRKNPSDLILAYSEFIKQIPTDKSQKCCLLLHTDPIDENGTNLHEVINLIKNENTNIIFTKGKCGIDTMNMLYNIANVTCLISSNEGWGLSLTESMMAGKMIIGNVTGGIQDQMKFEDENGKWITFDKDFGSNHYGTYKKCGEWAVPIFPNALSLAGSIQTPYIFDDRCDFRDVANALKKVYDMGPELREQNGLKGREWVLSDESKMSSKKMAQSIVEAIDETLKNFKPKAEFELIKITEQKPQNLTHKLIYE